MIRTMIIDDEPLAREFVRYHFPWEEWGCRIVAEASNGREALEICRQSRPEIMLIDITMPVMDGFELLEQVNRQYPEIRCIMLTAHRSFDYAQQAILKGCCGYILKSPVDLNEIRQVVDRAVSQIKEISNHSIQRKEQESILSNYQYPLRKKYFENIRNRIFHSDDEIVHYGKTIGVHLRADHYLLLYGEILNQELVYLSYSEKDRPLIEYSMLEVIRETLNSSFPNRVELFPCSFGSLCILMKNESNLSEFDTGQSYQAEVRKMTSTLNESLSQFLKLRLAFTVSGTFRSLSEMPKHYTQLLHYKHHRFYLGETKPVFVQSLPVFNPLPEDIQAGLSKDFQEVCTCTHYVEIELQRWCGKARKALLLYKPAPDEVKNWAAELMKSLPNELVMTDNLDSLLDSMAECVTKWQQARARNRTYRTEITRAMEYINNRLDEEISLPSLAHHVQLSPSYLGHLFKTEVGLPIVAYILQQRIEKAKSYLKEGQYLNYELAEKVGFRSYSHFCNMFKKITKMTPNEFKQSLWRQGEIKDYR